MYKKNAGEQTNTWIYKDGVNGDWLHGKFKVGYAFTYQPVTGVLLVHVAVEKKSTTSIRRKYAWNLNIVFNVNEVCR
jgi:hypothetical protein